MKIIIDASCVLAVLLGEVSAEEIIKKTEECQLFSARCLPFEIGNALTAAIKRRRISVEDALMVFEEYKKIPVTLIEPDFSASIKYGGEENQYAYDMYYMSCALSNGFPLLVFDKRFKEIAEKRGVKCL